MALARGEAAGISPLVVHGPAGVGKSRLLAGLVAERLLRRPETAVAHLEAEAFAAACAEAAGQPGGWADLRARFRGLDLFVLDDLHALERAPLALGELTHTLDALDDAGAAVAVSARVGPGQWSGWPTRLVNRLVGGLAVRVDPPGLASRRRYLLDRAGPGGSPWRPTPSTPWPRPPTATGPSTAGSRRAALTAKVDRRAARSAGSSPPCSPRTVPGRPPTLDRIARAVAERFGVRVRDLRSDTRRQTIADPRHLAMHLARDLTGLSFRAIGAYFGGRDPATVRHACKAAAARLAADPALAAAAGALRVLLRGSSPGRIGQGDAGRSP